MTTTKRNRTSSSTMKLLAVAMAMAAPAPIQASESLNATTRDHEHITSLLSSSSSSHPAPQRQLQQQQDLSCNVYTDFCPTQFNGVCDTAAANSSTSEPTCSLGSDCFDCDECRQFSTNCQGCLEHGCYWCPGDATCSNSDQYVLLNQQTSCSMPEDYVMDSCTAQDNFYSDPLYSAENWVYDMIQLVPVWQKGYSGLGIRVRINDNGIDASHPEFQGRIDLDASCTDYLPLGPNATENWHHGTSVAGIVGGAFDNDVCSVGMAPQVTLSSCNVFAEESADAVNFLDPTHFQLYDISQNSFGENACNPKELSRRNLQQAQCPFIQPDSSNVPFPCDVCSNFTAISPECENSIIVHCNFYWSQDTACLEFLDRLVEGGTCHYSLLSKAVQMGLEQAILEGRDGKGIIFVAAVGNTYEVGGDSNMGGYSTSRFVISVGAVGKTGLHASYSVTGTSVFCTAPGGDSDSVASHLTAGLTSQYIGNDNDCRDSGTGTSFACPVVSGVIALMLEANPDLTWRDVQEIIALTSLPVDDSEDTTASINAAGYWHSNYYGFGIIQANAAVERAETWTLVGDEQMIAQASGTINLPIVDNATIVTSSTIVLEATNDGTFIIQSVQVLLDLEYYSRGHLEIVLTSPQGTKSILHPGRRPENTQLDLDAGDRWKLLTLKSWGESPLGNWTLDIVDLVPGEVSTDCVDSGWSIDRSNMGDGTLDPITCNFLERIGACGDGNLNPFGLLSDQNMQILTQEYVDNGITATQACCACGGKGVSSNDVTDQLHQWTLVVHGRYAQDGAPSLKTPSPTGLPTTALPTKMPTIQPTLAPIPQGTTYAPSFNKNPTPVPGDGDKDTKTLPPNPEDIDVAATSPSPAPTEKDKDSPRDKLIGFFSACPNIRPNMVVGTVMVLTMVVFLELL